jgi:N-acetylmuramoyl-L-alanine amidase
MRLIDMIVVHCSFTKPRKNQQPRIGVVEIRKWHTDPVMMVDGKNIGGRGWSDIGYNYVIKRDGTLQVGRPLERSGAHARNFNAHSIGICLVGGMDKRTGKAVNDYTAAQWQTLRMVVGGLEIQFPNSVVCGHNDLTTAKTCPNFDVKEWWGEARNQ